MKPFFVRIERPREREKALSAVHQAALASMMGIALVKRLHLSGKLMATLLVLDANDEELDTVLERTPERVLGVYALRNGDHSQLLDALSADLRLAAEALQVQGRKA